MKQPNIFLIMAEDICPNIGCYGDLNAKTPRLDEFAKDNIKFNYCYSAAPVCSAARSSLNIGMYGPTAGVGQHRSMNKLPEKIKNIGAFMQEAGYYTAIGKTDFNYPLNGGYDVMMQFGSKDTPTFATDIVDVCDNNDTGKPLFMIQTSAITHQSQYGYTEDTAKHRETMPRLQEEDKQVREDIVIPGYHFDTPEARELWGQYHEKMTSFDRMFGEFVDALKAKGLYDDAIILFVGDNGHGIPEGKCDLWNEGVHVPMLLHVPADMESELTIESDENGKYSNRLTSFVDFAATFLSIAGAEIPEHLQGNVFLGHKRQPDPQDVFSFSERVDELYENSRSVHEKDVMYTCDFGLSPYRRLNVYQTTTSPWFVRSMIEKGYENHISDVDRRALFRQIPRVNEQLFDLNKDENSLVNIAEDESNKETVERLRNRMFDYIVTMRDDAMMLEPLLKQYIKETGLTAYEILNDDEYYPVAKVAQMYKDFLAGKDIACEITTPCEKIFATKFIADRGVCQETLVDFANDENEVVGAYAAYRLGDVEILEEICETTDNFYLLMYIADLVAVWRDGRALGCFEIIVDRYFGEKEFEDEIDDRYKAAMYAGLNMLAIRLKEDLPEGLTDDCYWDKFKAEVSNMVLDALDLQQNA